MRTDILEIEYKLADLETALPNISETALFDVLLSLRHRAFSHWVEEDPHCIGEDPATQLCDRITKIEQRLLDLAAKIPANSISTMKSKLKLWMLFKDLPGVAWPSADISDDLIVSVFMDLTRTSLDNRHASSGNTLSLKWVG